MQHQNTGGRSFFLFNKIVSWIALVTLVLIATAIPAQAALDNGGFEGGDFTGFSTIGNTSIENSTFGIAPTEGTYDAFLSTDGGVDVSLLDSFLNLTAGTLEATGFTNGSAISQTFTFNAGDTFSFSYDFLTNEDPTTGNADAAFAFLGPVNSTPGITFGIGTNADALTPAPPSTGFLNQTGYLTAGGIAFVASGTFTLSFVVLNEGNEATQSGLLIDDILLNGSTNGTGNGPTRGSSVPLPKALWTGLLGLFPAISVLRILRGVGSH